MLTFKNQDIRRDIEDFRTRAKAEIQQLRSTYSKMYQQIYNRNESFREKLKQEFKDDFVEYFDFKRHPLHVGRRFPQYLENWRQIIEVNWILPEVDNDLEYPIIESIKIEDWKLHLGVTSCLGTSIIEHPEDNNDFLNFIERAWNMVDTL